MKKECSSLSMFPVFRRMLCILCGVQMLLSAAGCADPWKEDVPDFEICSMTELPVTSAPAENRNYLMWWTLLGILPHDRESFPPEKESHLTGREQAPGKARFYHRLFQKEKDPAAAPGEICFSPLFAKDPAYRKRGRFYGCVTLKMDRTLKDAVLIAGSAGDLKIWVNGICVLDRKKEKTLSKVYNVLLRNGFNRIVLRYTDPETFDPDKRRFSLRFTGAEGNPMFVR